MRKNHEAARVRWSVRRTEDGRCERDIDSDLVLQAFGVLLA